MAYSFGTTAADRINIGAAFSSPLANASTFLIAGWWYPTSLVAGTKLWGVGGSAGASVASTTSEIVIKTLNATTNWEITTSGLNLVTNTWIFLCFVISCSNTTGASAVLWSGTDSYYPTEVTLNTTVTGSGNFTGNNTIVLGNDTTATSSWSGLIDNIIIVNQVGAPLGFRNPIPQSGDSLSAEEKDFTYYNIVLDIWKNKEFPRRLGFEGNYSVSKLAESIYVPLTNINLLPYYRNTYGSSTTVFTSVATVPGSAAPSNIASPAKTLNMFNGDFNRR